jgi:hypothetical protein
VTFPLRPPSRRRAPRFALWQEITLALVIKLIALCLIWLAFFSSPAGRHLDAGRVARSLLEAPAQDKQKQEAEHASRPGTR